MSLHAPASYATCHRCGALSTNKCECTRKCYVCPNMHGWHWCVFHRRRVNDKVCCAGPSDNGCSCKRPTQVMLRVDGDQYVTSIGPDQKEIVGDKNMLAARMITTDVKDLLKQLPDSKDKRDIEEELSQVMNGSRTVEAMIIRLPSPSSTPPPPPPAPDPYHIKERYCQKRLGQLEWLIFDRPWQQQRRPRKIEESAAGAVV